MKEIHRRRGVMLLAVVATLAISGVTARSQQVTTATAVFALPNPYMIEEGWPTLPSTMNGGKWGEAIRVAIAKDGHVWVYHRCFSIVPARQASCVNRGKDNPPLLEFEPKSGKFLRGLGVGVFSSPHGFSIAPDGYFWASDVSIPGSLGRGWDGLSPEIKAQAGVEAFPGDNVYKIDPKTDKVVMKLNKPGGFKQPTGVAVAPNGSIFVTEGHGQGRVNKFTKDGTYVKSWGQPGKGPDAGNFGDPHDVYVGGSKGWVYIADRNNNRIQVFDQDGNNVALWPQFARVNSVFVTNDDVIVVGSQQPDASKPNGAVRGVVVGNAITGALTYWVPDPTYDKLTGAQVPGSSASGVTMDAEGNIYAVDVGTRGVRKYLKKK